jgi:hypothetical protein
MLELEGRLKRSGQPQLHPSNKDNNKSRYFESFILPDEGKLRVERSKTHGHTNYSREVWRGRTPHRESCTHLSHAEKEEHSVGCTSVLRLGLKGCCTRVNIVQILLLLLLLV